jgi:hypothetical protein
LGVISAGSVAEEKSLRSVMYFETTQRHRVSCRECYKSNPLELPPTTYLH